MTHAPAPPPPPGPPENGVRPRGYGSEATIALVLGLVFLYLALPMLTWATGGFHGNPYGLIYPDEHPQAGQPIPYFQLPYGEQWRDLGALASGVTLLIEAALATLATVQPRLARLAWRVVLGVALEGVSVNFLAVVLQVRLGVTGPLYAVVGGVVCVLSAVAAVQQLRDLGRQTA